MILQERITLLGRLGEYMLGTDDEWLAIQERAFRENQWFIPEFIRCAVTNIGQQFLDKELLSAWADKYLLANHPETTQTVGIVMAGNIPLVGFHDLLCVFIAGHRALIKVSSKDEILLRHLAAKLCAWDPAVGDYIGFAEQLKGCDAYIATGSNNSGRYFDYYFGKYPHIIRRNRTSVALLEGNETAEELAKLSLDIQLYFGLGCRNVTQLYVPEGYDFIPLLQALKNYDHFMDFHKYKHNFDYHLALLIMGNKYYMSNDSVILTENISAFSPVSQVHYQFYKDKASVLTKLATSEEIQCVVGRSATPFGTAQSPSLTDYADGVDTLAFLKTL